MAGAPALAGLAALRAGAGLVTVATPACVQPTVAAAALCCLTRGLPETPDGSLALRGCGELLDLANANDVVALGPGLGSRPSTAILARRLISRIERPMIVDADGLNALAQDLSPLKASPAPRVLTPHPGEMARLCGLSGPGRVQARRRKLAVEFAAANRCVLALKGHRTIVTDGSRLYVNTTGNPGMATAGAGDVLTGVVAALLGQGLSPFDAAQLAVHVHGLAGDMARDRLGETSVTATDILDALPAAFQSVGGC